MNILLIDDDAATRESLADFFQKKGYLFVQASNGRIAIDIARQHWLMMHP
jgi:DNA-binding response OmpR family regulator